MKAIDTSKIQLHPIDTSNIVLHPEEQEPGLVSDIKDLGLGAVQGLTLGGADEAGAALQALYSKILGSNKTEDKLSLIDLYRQKQQELQKTFEAAKERSPYLYTGGQIAGGITSGSALGGMLGIGAGAAGLAEGAAGAGEALAAGAEVAPALTSSQRLLALGGRGLDTYKQALPLVAAESALSSEKGGLTSVEEAKQLGKDVLGGAAFALPATLGLQAVGEGISPLASKLKGKLSGIVEENPLLRQMKIAYGYGTEGINPKSQSATLNTELGATKLSGLDNERTMALLNEVQEADKRVGQAVGKSLEDATLSGKLINVDQETKQALEQVQTLADKYPEIVQNPKVQQIYTKISEANGDITPNDAKDLIDYMDSYISKFKSATSKNPGELGILSNLYNTRAQFSNLLKTQVPEYGIAANRFQQFRNLVPETIIAGARPVSVTDQVYGKATDKELFDPLKKLLQGSTKQGTSSGPTQQSFYNTMQGMKTFEQQEAERVTSGAIKAGEEAFQRPVSAIETQIKKYSDDAVARGSMDALDPHTGVGNAMKQMLTGTGDTGRSIALSSANLAGRLRGPISAGATKNPVAQISRAIYNAPSETVNALAKTLKGQAGLEKYGNQLEHALQSPDQNRRNQVLFTIMQNPSARAFVDQHTEEPQE